MSMRLIFWVLMLIWLVFGIIWPAAAADKFSYMIVGGNILHWILFALLGYKVFGKPITDS